MADNARKVALRVLLDAEKNKTYSNIAVDKALSKSELSGADRGLVTALCMGVTERRLTLDAIICALSQKGEDTDVEAKVLLRLGIYKLLYLDRIPDHAAVNETVELAPKRLRGFINAILREVLRRRESGRLDSLFPKREDGEGKYLSLKHSFPLDVCEKFLELYGFERTERIFERFNSAPPMTLRINTLKTSPEEYAALLEAANIAYRRSQRLENAIIVSSVAYDALPFCEEGYFFVQDEASQICVETIGAESGDLMIDVCSCPGSKSFGSAIRMGNKGEIRSFDLHKSKLSLIEKNAARLGIDIITAEERDGRRPDEGLYGKADKVLCDVPCSGLGVIAKKPEIRYKSISEFARLPEIQYNILSQSAKYVRAGGILVYSTCTVLPEENAENVKKFLSENPDFEAMDFSVGEIYSRDGMLSLIPDEHDTDGFFVAKMKRKE